DLAPNAPHNGCERAVRGCGYAVLLVEVVEVPMLQVGVELDLVDRGHDLCPLEDDLEVLLEEVGNTDGPGLAGRLDGLEVGPGAPELLRGLGPGGVGEVEVDVAEAELSEGGGAGLRGGELVEGGLGRNEDGLSRDARGADGFS